MRAELIIFFRKNARPVITGYTAAGDVHILCTETYVIMPVFVQDINATLKMVAQVLKASTCFVAFLDC